MSSVRAKMDMFQSTSHQAVSVEQSLPDNERLRQELMTTKLIEERLHTKAIFNDQLDTCLSLQTHNDQREKIQLETFKQKNRN